MNKDPGLKNPLSRLLNSGPDPRDELDKLWHKLIEIAREPDWYAQYGAEDSVTGRFDMICLVTSLAIIRMERDPVLSPKSAYLTELFVADMDSQLRESGLGDPTLGKHMGKLMSVLGGRIGAYREALKSGMRSKLQAAIERNITLGHHGGIDGFVASVLDLESQIAASDSRSLFSGEFRK